MLLKLDLKILTMMELIDYSVEYPIYEGQGFGKAIAILLGMNKLNSKNYVGSGKKRVIFPH